MKISESMEKSLYIDEFVNRHIGPDHSEIKDMLDVIGVDSIDSLIDETIPEQIRL